MEEGLGRPLVSTVPVQWKDCPFALFLFHSTLLEISAPPHLFAALSPNTGKCTYLQEKLKLEAQEHECDTYILSHELIPSWLFFCLPLASLVFFYFTPNYAGLHLELLWTAINSLIEMQSGSTGYQQHCLYVGWLTACCGSISSPHDSLL